MDNLALKDDYGTGTQVTQNSLQLIAFSIGEQTYGVEITTVREIRAWNGATPLPNTREYVRGVINLRGTILGDGNVALIVDVQGLKTAKLRRAAA